MKTEGRFVAYALCLGALFGAAGTPSTGVARPPLFELDPIADQSARQDTPLTTQVSYKVTDEPCFDSIALSLDAAPPTMRISQAGQIAWTPRAADAGQSFPVVVRARGIRVPGSPCHGAAEERTRAFSVAVTGVPVLPTTFRASGRLQTHNLEAPKGPMKVTVAIETLGTCTARTVAHYSGHTDANGDYSISWTAPSPAAVACFVPFFGYTFGYQVLVSAFGDDTKATSGGTFVFDASGRFGPVGGDVSRSFVNAPELASEDGHWWARRIGPMTGFPLIDIEGFDPSNNFSSDLRAALLGCSSLDDQACDVSCLTMPGETAADCDFTRAPNNVRDYLVANGYTIWLVLSGPNSGRSLKGSAANGYTDGAVYQAMNITKKILDVTAAQVGSVRAALHGYSMGGPIARAGLRHWCHVGTWESSVLGELRLPQADCDNIGLWISGDAPLEGAIAPLAAMRYIKNLSVNPGVLASINTPAARELLTQWVTDGCDTNCKDPGGCNSSESDFRRGCRVDNSVFHDFQNWAKGTGYAYPRYRDGKRIPGVAYAQGAAPGARPGDPHAEFLKTDVENLRDHHLLFNTAGDGCDVCGNTEWVNGSLNNSAYKTIHGANSSGGILGGLVGGYKVSMLVIPPYGSSASALDWSSDRTQWWDYRYNAVNGFHAGPVFKEANHMVLAWVHEHLKGDRSGRPICTEFRNVGQKAVCRPPAPEVCDGRDNNGDERIDEGLFCTADKPQQ